MMELTKYKACPECGKHNSPNLLECRYCEADLTGVKVVDNAAEEADSKRQMQAQLQLKWSLFVFVSVVFITRHKPESAKYAARTFLISYPFRLKRK